MPKKDAENGETCEGSCIQAKNLTIPNGATPHRRELKGSRPPKWVMRSWPDPRARSLERQASKRPEYKDGACCDDRCTKSVVNGANRHENALRYSSLGSVDTKDQNRLQPASIPRGDRRDHLATKMQR